jgi:hypothetical protein
MGPAHPRYVTPVVADQLNRCLELLNPLNPSDNSRRESARNQIRSILNDLYVVLISSDPLTRWVRGLRRTSTFRRSAWVRGKGETSVETEVDEERPANGVEHQIPGEQSGADDS